MIRSLFLLLCLITLPCFGQDIIKVSEVETIITEKVVRETQIIDKGEVLTTSTSEKEVGPPIKSVSQLITLDTVTDKFFFDIEFENSRRDASANFIKLDDKHYIADKPGTYYLEILTSNFDRDKLVLKVEGGEDEEEPDVTPVDGLQVLVIYERQEFSKLPAEQQIIWGDPSIRAYLDSHCKKVNNLPQWQFIDQNTIFPANYKGVFDDWLKDAKKESLPWIVISGVYEGPLPPNVPATLQLLKKYGGD